MAMEGLPLGTEFWNWFYKYSEWDDETYNDALETPESDFEDRFDTDSEDIFFQRLEVLWGWKGLRRSKSVSEIRSNISKDTLFSIVDEADNGMEIEEAVKEVQEELDVYKGEAIVSHAFLLHVAACVEIGKDQKQFPIFDTRVWTAYHYLTSDSTNSESADEYRAIPKTPEDYREFCDFIRDNLPSSGTPRKLDKSLFAFGKFVSNIEEQNDENQDTKEKVNCAVSELRDAIE
jgi:hypothetical protein